MRRNKAKNGYIIVLCGKSACGKTSIAKQLIKCGYKNVVPYTTRPIRENEVNGVDYHFVDDVTFDKLDNDGCFVESRTYNTVDGIWKYATRIDNINLQTDSYVLVATLDVAKIIQEYYGRNHVITIFLTAPLNIRTMRAKHRGNFNLEEWNRRTITDNQDFKLDTVAKVCDFKVDTSTYPQRITLQRVLKLIHLYIIRGLI